MDCLNLITEIVKVAAWPATTLVIVWWLRPYLGGLASRLEELTLPGGVGAKFGRELDEARQIETSISVETSEARAKTIDVADPILTLANTFPEAAILQAYQELERVFVKNQGVITNIDPSRRLRDLDNSIINGLRGAGLLSDGWMDLFGRVRNLRDVAVHARGANRVSAGEALEYLALCRSLKAELSDAIKKYSGADKRNN